MKKIIQLAIFIVILFSSYALYKIYFFDPGENKFNKNRKEIVTDINQENLITNLNYKIELNDRSVYEINSKTGEIVQVNNNEIIKMNNVTANYKNKDEVNILILADKAEYTKNNHNTIFEENIEIIYLNNKIFSNKMILNFQEKTLRLSENVKYISLNKNLYADRLDLNLITKKIDIYMDENNKKVLIISK